MRRCLVAAAALLLACAVLRAEEVPCVFGFSNQNADPRAAGDEIARAIKDKLGNEKPRLLLVATAHKKGACRPLLDALAAGADKGVIFGAAGVPAFSEKFTDPAALTTSVLAFSGDLDVQAFLQEISAAEKRTTNAAEMKAAGLALAKQVQIADNTKERLLLVLAYPLPVMRHGQGVNEGEPWWFSEGLCEGLGGTIPVSGSGLMNVSRDAAQNPALIVHGEIREDVAVGLLLTGQFHAGGAMGVVTDYYAGKKKVLYANSVVSQAMEGAGTKPVAAFVFTSLVTDYGPWLFMNDARVKMFAQVKEKLGEVPLWGFAGGAQFGRVRSPLDTPVGSMYGFALNILGSATGELKQAKMEFEKEGARPADSFLVSAAAIQTAPGQPPTEKEGEDLAKKLLEGLGGEKPKVVLWFGGLRNEWMAGLGKTIDPKLVNGCGIPGFFEDKYVPGAAVAFAGKTLDVQIAVGESDPEGKKDAILSAGESIGKKLKIQEDGKAKLLIAYCPGHLAVGSMFNGIQAAISDKKIPMFGGSGCAIIEGKMVDKPGKESAVGVLLSGDFTMGAAMIVPQGNQYVSVKGALLDALRDVGKRPKAALLAGCGNHTKLLPNYAKFIRETVGRPLFIAGTSPMSGELGSFLAGEPPQPNPHSCPVVILGNR